MNVNRLRQIEEIYHAAAACSEAERAAFLKQACGGDLELRQEVESLLAEERRADGFLQTPAWRTEALPPGGRVGPYEVLGVVGVGGMGEVYHARDTRLGRDVALKILPDVFAGDPERLARFGREAQVLAALNHPHIVTIYEIESAGDVDFLVTEYVAGQTLSTVIPRGGLRVPEVLRVAIPLADAVATAHAAGIVHRDLKPSNVMVTPDGVVKVLDFGLAKLLTREAPSLEAPTTLTRDTPPLSGAGTVAGTVGYMSPEQAAGGVVDARSDIFSFGAVLYEMVTGRRAFSGSSSAEIQAAVLRDAPTPPHEIVADVPAELERILLRCLRKDPARRFHSMHDVRVELQEVKEESDSQVVAGGTVGRGTRRRPALVALAVVLAVVTTATALWYRRPLRPAPRVVQLSPGAPVHAASFSPDGTQVVFASPRGPGPNWGLWVMVVGDAEPRQLSPDQDPAPEGYPAWSPDGKHIAFLRWDKATDYFSPGFFLYLVSPVSGAERRLSDFRAAFSQLSWSPDARWVAAVRAPAPNATRGMGIWRVPVEGGEPQQVTFPSPSADHGFPAVAPDGGTLAFSSCEGLLSAPRCDIWVVRLDAEGRPQGEARRLTRQRFAVEGIAWTRDGRSVVYGGQGLEEGSRLWRVRADGSVPQERVEVAGLGASLPFTAACCDRLGYQRQEQHVDIHRVEVGGRVASLIESSSFDYLPAYAPDGQRIAFTSNRGPEGPAIWLADADGSQIARLTRGPGRHQRAPNWSPDGRTIAFESQADNDRFDIWTIGVDGAGLRQVTRDPADENLPSWSRDGTSLYFTSNRTGRPEVWRIAVASGVEAQVTTAGGWGPSESLDGRTLYYTRLDSGELLARPTTGGPERSIVACSPPSGYAVGPGGVFHIDCRPPAGSPGPLRALRYWDAATGQDRQVATVDRGGGSVQGLSASPDGRAVVYGRWSITSDLLMIEHFR